MDTVYASPEFGIAGSWLAEYTLSGLHAGVIVFDAHGCASQWNRAAAELLGVREEALAGRGLDDPVLGLVDCDALPLASGADPVRRTLAGAEPVLAESIGVPTAGGGLAWRRIDVLPVFGMDRSPRAALATVVDRAPAGGDDTAWASIARALLATDLTANVVVDDGGTVVHWNAHSLELTGRSADEMRGRHLAEICDIDVEWLDEQLARSGAQHVGGITWVRHRDGGEIAVVARFFTVPWPDAARAVVVQLLDTSTFGDLLQVTPSHADERVFAHAHTPMLVISHQGDVVGANRSALSLFDAHVVDLVGRPLTQCLAGLDPGTAHSAIAEAELMETPTTLGTYLARALNGAEIPVATSLTSLGRPGGGASATLLVQLASPPPQSASEPPSGTIAGSMTAPDAPRQS